MIKCTEHRLGLEETFRYDYGYEFDYEYDFLALNMHVMLRDLQQPVY